MYSTYVTRRRRRRRALAATESPAATQCESGKRTVWYTLPAAATHSLTHSLTVS